MFDASNIFNARQATQRCRCPSLPLCRCRPSVSPAAAAAPSNLQSDRLHRVGHELLSAAAPCPSSPCRVPGAAGISRTVAAPRSPRQSPERSPPSATAPRYAQSAIAPCPAPPLPPVQPIERSPYWVELDMSRGRAAVSLITRHRWPSPRCRAPGESQARRCAAAEPKSDCGHRVVQT